MGQLLIGIYARSAAAAKPVREFSRCRHGGRAGMARHHDRTAGVGQACSRQKIHAAQKSGHQAGGEGVASAQHIHHFDPFSLRGKRLVQALWHWARDEAASSCSELDHQGRRCNRAHGAQ